MSDALGQVGKITGLPANVELEAVLANLVPMSGAKPQDVAEIMYLLRLQHESTLASLAQQDGETERILTEFEQAIPSFAGVQNVLGTDICAMKDARALLTRLASLRSPPPTGEEARAQQAEGETMKAVGRLLDASASINNDVWYDALTSDEKRAAVDLYAKAHDEVKALVAAQAARHREEMERHSTACCDCGDESPMTDRYCSQCRNQAAHEAREWAIIAENQRKDAEAEVARLRAALAEIESELRNDEIMGAQRVVERALKGPTA